MISSVQQISLASWRARASGVLSEAESKRCRKAELRDHSREVALAASKGSPKGSIEARCVPRSGGNSAKRHAGHQVFQPSGRFF